MKPTSNSKNQRVSKPRQRRQQHLLEVSVRRDIAVTQRNRAIFFFVCKTILIAGLIIGGYIGGKEGLRRFLWENPDYYLSDVRVTTDGALTREQILSTANIVEGVNIFTIDLEKGRTALDQLPQVERVELQRMLPNKLAITITERRPIAWVVQGANEDPTVSEKAFLIDARGVVMRSRTMLPEYLHLPVITGVEIGNLAPGQKVRSYEMQAALDLVRLSSDNNRFQARKLDLSKGYCVVVTDQKLRKISFGLEGVDKQLDRFMHYLDFLEPSGKEIQTVNLLVERNTPFTFVDPNALDAGDTPPPIAEKAPPAKPASTKSTPTAKKPEATSTPAASPATKPTKDSTPAGSKRNPVDSVKKPFRLHG